MSQENIKLYVDVRKFNRRDFAAAITENNKAPEKERITPYEMQIDLLGNCRALNPETGQWDEFKVSMEKEIDRAEADAVYVIQRLARIGLDNILIISPPGGENNYPTNRLMLYKVTSIDDDFVRVKSWGICGIQDRDECLDIAQRMVNGGCVSLGELTDPEDLRMYPLGFNTRKGEEIDYLKRVFKGMDEIWDKIETNEVVSDFEVAEKIADYVELNYRNRIEKVRSFEDGVRLGALIEYDISRRFNRSLLAGGAHGMSNTAALGLMDNRGTIKSGAFDLFFGLSNRVSAELDSRLEMCEICHKAYMKKKKRCPKCFPEN